MRSTAIKNNRRARRNTRVRTKLREISTLPRLCVSRSTKHIQAQVVDDLSGKTLVHATSTAKFGAEDAHRLIQEGIERAKKA